MDEATTRVLQPGSLVVHQGKLWPIIEVGRLSDPAHVLLDKGDGYAEWVGAADLSDSPLPEAVSHDAPPTEEKEPRVVALVELAPGTEWFLALERWEWVADHVVLWARADLGDVTAGAIHAHGVAHHQLLTHFVHAPAEGNAPHVALMLARSLNPDWVVALHGDQWFDGYAEAELRDYLGALDAMPASPDFRVLGVRCMGNLSDPDTGGSVIWRAALPLHFWSGLDTRPPIYRGVPVEIQPLDPRCHVLAPFGYAKVS